MKQRWAAQTVTAGLCRESAAWFLLGRHAWSTEALPTLAVAFYLALSASTRMSLCDLAEPGNYVRVLGRSPGLVPALLLFRDAPTGNESLHRYLWLGSQEVDVTAPYTNVRRAGRSITPRKDFRVVTLGLDTVRLAEREIERVRPPYSWWSAEPLIERIPSTGRNVGQGRITKLGMFCERLANSVNWTENA